MQQTIVYPRAAYILDLDGRNSHITSAAAGGADKSLTTRDLRFKPPPSYPLVISEVVSN
jgi:hypothetical protein